MKFQQVKVPSGEIFGRLTIVSEAAKHKKNRAFLCRCECGKYCKVLLCNLRTGHTKSCGCLLMEIAKTICVTHGMSGKNTRNRTYRIWSNIKTRCLNPNSPAYKDYGGRGICICDQWKDSFETFLADMGQCPEGMSIERKDNDIGYCKDNCQWATPKQQANNRRSSKIITALGYSRTISEWSDVSGLGCGTIQYRISNGWECEDAVTLPSSRGNPKLTAAEVLEIKSSALNISDLAKKFSVSRKSITNILRSNTRVGVSLAN